MSARQRLARILFGTQPKLHRMLRYWGATGLFYLVCIGLIWIQVQARGADQRGAIIVCCYCAAGVLFFFGLVRISFRLGLAPWKLAVCQALFAISCNMGAYAVTGPLRGATLMVLLVVIVFCTFALRPRQTLILCATAILALGATMAALVARDPLRYPAPTEAMHFTLAALSLLAVTVLTGEMSKLRSRLKQQKEELLAAVTTIRTLATVDELTSLANRRHMSEVLADAERRQGARAESVCIALLDIDRFKDVNDRYGHAGGDAVLCAFAGALRAELRSADMLARWGGEEFLLMLPNTELAEAGMVLRRMAERVGAMQVPGLDLAARISFSAGVAARGGAEPFAATIMRADKAMYLAKSSGRNRVVAG